MQFPDKWRYRLMMLPRAPFQILYWWMQTMAFSLNPSRKHQGLFIADLVPGCVEGRFIETTIAALDLIRDTDLLRFTRIRREFNYIVQTVLPTPARYKRISKVCNVDLAHFPFSEFPEFSLKAYACTLVHEATHGYLHAKAVPHIQRLKTDVERICTLEAIRFAQRFQDSSYNWESSLLEVYTDSQRSASLTLAQKLKYLKSRLSEQQ